MKPNLNDKERYHITSPLRYVIPTKPFKVAPPPRAALIKNTPAAPSTIFRLLQNLSGDSALGSYPPACPAFPLPHRQRMNRCNETTPTQHTTRCALRPAQVVKFHATSYFSSFLLFLQIVSPELKNKFCQAICFAALLMPPQGNRRNHSPPSPPTFFLSLS